MYEDHGMNDTVNDKNFNLIMGLNFRAPNMQIHVK